jgi:two-component system nitrogen regulation sensor histidine kinase GlnL
MTRAVGSFLEEHWLNILESLDDGLVIISESGTVEFMNEGAAQLTGLSSAQATGARATQVFAGNPWLLELLATTRTSGVRNVRADASLVGRSRAQRPIRAASTIVVDAEGNARGTLLTLHDLSYQRELESRLREADRLGQLEILLAGLAHEIKNPLSGMRGAAQLLASGSTEAKRIRECTQIIVGEIDRLNGLMTQLLDLTGPARLERAAVNIHEIVDRVLAIEGATVAGRLSFVRRFDPSLPPVLGDAGRLTQVLLNLVRNAIEASPQGGTITLTSRMETSYYLAGAHGREQFLSLDVADRGTGIAAQDLPRIFSPFFTTKSDGTGLGLAISQRIVTEHGGVLRVRSEPGEGTVFTVTLPVDRGANNHV